MPLVIHHIMVIGWGTIIYQNMVAGTKVNKGSTLQITVVKNEEVSDSEPDDKE